MTSTVNNPGAGAADREILMTRIYDAPRDLVWTAWTDPQQIIQWWGPRGFTNTTQTMEVKPGGVWRFCMHGPDGRDYENKITYLEVVKPEKLVYKHGGDKDTEPVNFQVTVTFEALGERTKLEMRLVFPSAAAKDFVVREYGAIEGGKQTLERLSEYLATIASASPTAGANALTGEFVISRVFDAPRELVWKAWTERDRLMEWFGPKGFRMSTASADFRPGGTFHYCLTSPQGQEMWGKWVLREIVPMEKVVAVSSFSDAAGGITRHPMSATWPLETISTTTFHDHAGIGRGTLVTIRWSPLNPTAAERQTFDTSRESMKMGWGGTFEQLEAYLAKQ